MNILFFLGYISPDYSGTCFRTDTLRKEFASKDDEELALTLNGRKKKLQREDFIRSAATLDIENVIVEDVYKRQILALGLPAVSCKDFS